MSSFFMPNITCNLPSKKQRLTISKTDINTKDVIFTDGFNLTFEMDNSSETVYILHTNEEEIFPRHDVSWEISNTLQQQTNSICRTASGHADLLLCSLLCFWSPLSSAAGC